MANKCIYFNYIFCKSWHEPNGFRAEIPYSWIFVLVWTDPNAILSLDAKSIRRDLFLIENWTSTRIFGTPMLRGFSPGIKAWNKNQPWVLPALRAELLQVAPRRGTSRLHDVAARTGVTSYGVECSAARQVLWCLQSRAAVTTWWDSPGDQPGSGLYWWIIVVAILVGQFHVGHSGLLKQPRILPEME